MEILRIGEISLKSYLDRSIYICGILRSADVRKMKNGHKSLTLVLSDRDKEAEVKWFDIEQSHADGLEIGEVYCIYVEIKAYAPGKDGLSLIVIDNNIGKCNADKKSFINWEENTQWSYNEINRLLDYIGDSTTGKIAIKLIRDNLNDVTMFPAASSMHHSGLGGLSVHIAGVACACEKMADFYKGIYGDGFINKQLLISGALLHDIGKVKELELNGADKAEYSTLGKLGNHIMYGIIMIEEAAVDLGYRDNREVYELIHLIGSHHGKKEYGSPIEPGCIEADILSKMDDLDAVAYRRYKTCRELEPGTGTVEWRKDGLYINYKVLKEEKVPEI